MKYQGNLEITKENQHKYKDLVEVTGDLYINSNATLSAEALTTVGGNLYINSNTTLSALTTVGGYLSINSNATLSAKNIKNKYSDKAKELAAKKLALSFKKKGLIKSDGILSWIVSSKKLGSIVTMKVRIVGKSEITYLIQKGTTFSHGKTIKEAKESLKYKVSSRDTTPFKKWKLNTVVSQAKMIEAYRVITGACEYGVKNFCEGKKLPSKLSVKKAIEITQGAYASETFERFFK